MNVFAPNTVEQIEVRALREVNHLRATYRIGPPLGGMPRGQRNSATHCPVAHALFLSRADEEILCGGALTSGIGTPWEIRNFMHVFDAGALKHLIA